jgi:putative nucleotidyltransferase with HDIG domain
MTQDMGMTAKILQLASSVFFGARSPIANPEQAALILGCDVLRALMQVPRAFSKFDPVNLQPLSIDAVWRHSLATSTLARRIAAEQGCDAGAIDCAFVAGMLHDVGILVLAQHLPASCQQVWELTRQDEVAVGDAERAVFGTTHAEIGAYLLGLWGLDPAIVDAVAWHHRPVGSAAATFTPLTAVHVADALARDHASFPPDAACLGGLGEKIDETYLARIGVTERLPYWRTLAQEVSKDFNER